MGTLNFITDDLTGRVSHVHNVTVRIDADGIDRDTFTKELSPATISALFSAFRDDNPLPLIQVLTGHGLWRSGQGYYVPADVRDGYVRKGLI